MIADLNLWSWAEWDSGLSALIKLTASVKQRRLGCCKSSWLELTDWWTKLFFGKLELGLFESLLLRWEDIWVDWLKVKPLIQCTKIKHRFSPSLSFSFLCFSPFNNVFVGHILDTHQFGNEVWLLTCTKWQTRFLCRIWRPSSLEEFDTGIHCISCFYTYLWFWMSFDFYLSFKIPVFACTTNILFLEFKNW